MVRVTRGEMQGMSSRDKAPVAAGIPENERGMALVLALVMLSLLTILGVWAIGTASSDLSIAGNFRNTQNAFYSADAALAYAVNPDTLTKAYLYTVATGTTAVWSQVISIGTATANIKVNYLGSGPLPAGSLCDGDLDVNGNPRFHGLYFAVNTEGNAANNAVAEVEAAVVQAVEEDVSVGYSGGIGTSDATAGGRVFLLYWRQR
jgi:hypothetical protein